tara:strand:- start:1540 stop:2034 length:495 start_codon:yes stop_codon:yes gene_type:complete
MQQAEELLARCREARLKIATVESCTGGLVAALLTAIPGSSDVVERGFVTYSNQAKQDLVAVPAALLAQKGAVSSDVARAMAAGGLANSRADFCVSLTGIAGPGGGSATKPVGLVYLGVARRGQKATAERCLFTGNRQEIRRAALEKALVLLARQTTPPSRGASH